MLHMLQWLYTYVSSVYFKCFICIRRTLQIFSSGCCIYMHVASVFSSGFMCFASVSSDACFKCFHLSSLYVATVVFRCFKSRSRVAHEMSVGNGRWRGRRLRLRGRCPRWWGPAARALARKPDVLGARSSVERVPSDASAPDRT